MQSSRPRIFYGWFIVAASFMVMFCTIGIVNNCSGLYIKPVCDDMGFSRGAMGVNMTILSICQMLVALFGGKIFVKFDVKKIMRISSILLAVGYFSYSLATSLPVFYLISVVVGFAMGGTTTMPLSLLIGNWFHQRRGFAVGVAFMGSGIGGMLFNSLAGQLITEFGWRATYRTLGIIAFVVLVPVCWLVIRTKPADMGLAPYGQAANESTEQYDNRGMTLKEAMHTGRFWALCLVTAVGNVSLCALNQNVTPHLSDEGYALTTAANISAIMLGGLAVGKMTLGWLYDKLGVRRTTLLANCSTILALVGTLLCRFPPMIAAIVLGFSIGNAFGSIGNQVIVQSIYGRKNYSAILGVVAACNSLAGSVTPVLIGGVYDLFGSYTPAFATMVVTSSLAAISYFILLSQKVEYEA
ncbi:MAG TPA: MFS transporter [Firmicutes bacterium]|nr:MFS transporter [Bacillota bacterium]